MFLVVCVPFLPRVESYLHLHANFCAAAKLHTTENHPLQLIKREKNFFTGFGSPCIPREGADLVCMQIVMHMHICIDYLNFFVLLFGIVIHCCKDELFADCL